GSRFTVFLSKLCVILFATILYYGFVMISLVIGSVLMNVMLPDGLAGVNLVQGALMQSFFMQFGMPVTLSELVYELFFVVMMFSILSTFVMLDRSKKIWGMVMGALYGIGTIVLFLFTKSLFLYQDEVFFVNWAFVLGVTIVSTLLSAYLLNKKVSI
ncbi:MAG TPA: hypothetical protein DCY20_00775, partial [Firmicutes bacterium]|nr:hypothetical protein [Bacillota bacterium]